MPLFLRQRYLVSTPLPRTRCEGEHEPMPDNLPYLTDLVFPGRTDLFTTKAGICGKSNLASGDTTNSRGLHSCRRCHTNLNCSGNRPQTSIALCGSLLNLVIVGSPSLVSAVRLVVVRESPCTFRRRKALSPRFRLIPEATTSWGIETMVPVRASRAPCRRPPPHQQWFEHDEAPAFLR